MRHLFAKEILRSGIESRTDKASGRPRSLLRTSASREASLLIPNLGSLPSVESMDDLQSDAGDPYFIVGYSAPNSVDKLSGVVSPPSVSLDAPDVFYRLADVTDSTASALDLTNNSSVAFASGLLGNCATFDGTTVQWLSRADSALLSAGARSFCFVFWVRVSEVPPSYDRCVFSKGRISTNREYRLLLSTSDKFIWRVYDSAGTAYDVNSSYDPISTHLNEWLFGVAGYDDSLNQAYLNIMGAADFTTLGGLSMRDGADDFRIGIVDQLSGTASVRACWKGEVDALGILSYQPTSLQMDRLYNLGYGLEYYSRAWQ